MRSTPRPRPLACLALVLASGSAPDAQARPAPRGLTVFRPQNGAGYAPFERTAVPDELETDPALGPGIRVNGPGEVDPAGEDDLLELLVRPELEHAPHVLVRGGPELLVWRTRTKQAGTALAFTGDTSAPLDFGGGASLTLWVEWNGAPAQRALALHALGAAGDVELDRVLFHAFRGLVVALGGEGQSPSVPVDPNHGTFLVGIDLYERGYDVLMRDEDAVSADGSGAVYNEVVNAIQHRAVAELAIFGYSHGGGSTHDLCGRLEAFRLSIGTFAIPFTSYVDGVENSSDFDVDMELRRPPASGHHVNHYQHGSFADFFLDGGPVPSSVPPPTGLDVEGVPFGTGATHFDVDDFNQVRNKILLDLEPRLNR